MSLYYIFLILEQFHDWPHLAARLFTAGIIIMTPVKLAGIATLAAALILPRPRDAAGRVKNWIGPLYFAFAAASVLSLLVWSLPLGNSLSLSFLISFALLLPATRLLICTETRIRNVVRTIVLSAAFSTLWVFREHFAGVARAFGVSNDPNYEALVLVTILPLALWMARSEAKRSWRRAGAVSAAALTISVLFTQSRGGIIALAVVALPEVIRARRKPAVLLALAAGIIVLVALAPSSFWQRFSTMSITPTAATKNNPSEESVQARIELAKAAWNMIKQHPVVGIGLDRFRLEAPKFNPGLGRRHWVAHDTYLQIAAESGIPALALFLLIMGAGFTNCRAAERLCPDSALGDLGPAIRGGLRGFAVGAAFITAWFVVPYWVLLFLSQNLREVAVQAVRRRAASDPRATGRSERPRKYPAIVAG